MERSYRVWALNITEKKGPTTSTLRPGVDIQEHTSQQAVRRILNIKTVLGGRGVTQWGGTLLMLRGHWFQCLTPQNQNPSQSCWDEGHRNNYITMRAYSAFNYKDAAIKSILKKLEVLKYENMSSICGKQKTRIII